MAQLAQARTRGLSLPVSGSVDQARTSLGCAGGGAARWQQRGEQYRLKLGADGGAGIGAAETVSGEIHQISG